MIGSILISIGVIAFTGASLWLFIQANTLFRENTSTFKSKRKKISFYKVYNNDDKNIEFTAKQKDDILKSRKKLNLSLFFSLCLSTLYLFIGFVLFWFHNDANITEFSHWKSCVFTYFIATCICATSIWILVEINQHHKYNITLSLNLTAIPISLSVIMTISCVLHSFLCILDEQYKNKVENIEKEKEKEEKARKKKKPVRFSPQQKEMVNPPPDLFEFSNKSPGVNV